MSIISIKDLSISFSMNTNSLSITTVQVVDGVSFDLETGEILTIVGSSGSGKSVFASALFDILPANASVQGRILYKGKEVPNLLQKALYIPQTTSFLDPLLKVNEQIELSAKPLSQKAQGLYPFQCSGGMLRSVLFDLVHENKQADIIIADEPTPGMDVSTAVQALSDLRDLANQGKSIILITHDIDLASTISDRIAVFYNGRIVEIVSARDFEKGVVQQDYTRALYNALPQNSFFLEEETP